VYWGAEIKKRGITVVEMSSIPRRKGREARSIRDHHLQTAKEVGFGVPALGLVPGRMTAYGKPPLSCSPRNRAPVQVGRFRSD